MAITYQSAGAVATTQTGTLSPAYPASIGNTDYLVLIVGHKPSTANGGTVTTPGGWTLVGSLAASTNPGGYSTTTGADVGNTSIFGYTKAAAGTETGSLSVTVGTVDIVWGQILRFSHNGTGWAAAAAVTGADSTSGDVSITGGSDPGIAGGDYVIGGFCAASDNANYDTEAFSATGVTFGPVTEVSEPKSTTNNDIGGFVIVAPASSGTSSAAPVMTATTTGTTTNAKGPGIILRIRETGAPPATDTTKFMPFFM